MVLTQHLVSSLSVSDRSVHRLRKDFILNLCTERSLIDSGVDLGCNRTKYQEYFLGGKGGRCVGLTTLPPSCGDCLQIWKLNFLETLEPVQACTGIALTL